MIHWSKREVFCNILQFIRHKYDNNGTLSIKWKVKWRLTRKFARTVCISFHRSIANKYNFFDTRTPYYFFNFVTHPPQRLFSTGFWHDTILKQLIAPRTASMRSKPRFGIHLLAVCRCVSFGVRLVSASSTVMSRSWALGTCKYPFPYKVEFSGFLLMLFG